MGEAGVNEAAARFRWRSRRGRGNGKTAEFGEAIGGMVKKTSEGDVFLCSYGNVLANWGGGGNTGRGYVREWPRGVLGGPSGGWHNWGWKGRALGRWSTRRSTLRLVSLPRRERENRRTGRSLYTGGHIRIVFFFYFGKVWRSGRCFNAKGEGGGVLISRVKDEMPDQS